MTVEHDLKRVIERVGEGPDVAGLVARVESEDRTLVWEGSTGELGPDRPFFIASTTKIYTTAIVLRLSERGSFNLDDRLVDLVDSDLVGGIHLIRGIDRTNQITVRHLLAHTSGLPDYFSGRQRAGDTLEHTLRSGSDVGWTLHDVLETARQMGAAFPPGQPGRALYSDTNFQLLGRLIEEATGVSYADSLRIEIIEPLGVEGTWLYVDPADTRPAPLRDGKNRLDIPKAMTSFGPDGGIVATVGDLMTFLRGFFEGRLFDPSIIPQLQRYNRIFFPLEYGVGFARFRLPRIFSPWTPSPELIGHSGLSGAFAFFAPERTRVPGRHGEQPRPPQPIVPIDAATASDAAPRLTASWRSSGFHRRYPCGLRRPHPPRQHGHCHREDHADHHEGRLHRLPTVPAQNVTYVSLAHEPGHHERTEDPQYPRPPLAGAPRNPRDRYTLQSQHGDRRGESGPVEYRLLQYPLRRAARCAPREHRRTGGGAPPRPCRPGHTPADRRKRERADERGSPSDGSDPTAKAPGSRSMRVLRPRVTPGPRLVSSCRNQDRRTPWSANPGSPRPRSPDFTERW